MRAGARYRRRLAATLALVGAFFVVEAVGGVLTGSLALLSDAGHMLTDVLGLGMALAAIQLATREERRGGSSARTFGLYRLEILAAFANALLLFAVAVWVVVEAARRLSAPPEILTTPLLVIAALGLAVNLLCWALLREGARENLNLRGASLELLADALGSVGVIVAGLAVALFGWGWADPVIGAAIGVAILPRTWRLGREAVRVLIQAAPPDIDPQAMEADLAAIPGVVGVHDVHVWTLTSQMESASAHLSVCAGVAPAEVLGSARTLLVERYGIDHATVQVEPQGDRACDELTW